MRPLEAPEPFALFLLPPLWSIVSDYFDPAERWYCADIKTFRIRSPFVTSKELLDVVIRKNHPHILGSLCDLNNHRFSACPLDHVAINMMILYDRAEMLEHVRKHNRKAVATFYENDGRRAAHISVNHGSLEVIRWERRRGYRLERKETMATLAYYGHTEVLKQLRADRWPWDAETYTAAIRGNVLSTIEWLRTSDLDISEVNICKHINTADTLEYFVNTAPDEILLDKMLCYAVHNSSLSMVRYLIENTRVMDLVPESEVVGWTCSNHVHIIQYLLGRGFPRPRRLPGLMTLAVERWLRANYDDY